MPLLRISTHSRTSQRNGRRAAGQWLVGSNYKLCLLDTYLANVNNAPPPGLRLGLSITGNTIRAALFSNVFRYLSSVRSRFWCRQWRMPRSALSPARE
ncbi:MAG: hypothetical protein M3R61_20955 [Chloroflexota bacterium]|nr:hypothetical protein [Chloroflexota bacterium]